METPKIGFLAVVTHYLLIFLQLRLEERDRENASLTRQLENALTDIRRQQEQTRDKQAAKVRDFFHLFHFERFVLYLKIRQSKYRYLFWSKAILDRIFLYLKSHIPF